MTIGTRQSSGEKSRQHMVLEEPDIHLQGDETGPLPFTVNKNQLKMDQRFQRKAEKRKRQKHKTMKQPLTVDLSEGRACALAVPLG